MAQDISKPDGNAGAEEPAHSFSRLYDALPHIHQLGKDLRKAMAINPGSPQSLLCLDLSDLHKISQIFGWNTGTELRKTIINWCTGPNFPHSVLYDAEGDIFCLWFPNKTCAEIEEIAAEISSRCAEPWLLSPGGRTVPCVCDIFLSVLCVSSGNLLSLNLIELIIHSLGIARAEKRIYVHDSKSNWQENEHQKRVRLLNESVEQNMAGFSVAFQPIIDMNTGTWSGLEALCRWHHPELGLVPPLIFIPETERQGLIIPIGYWILEFAIEQCMSLKLNCYEDFFLTVNVSPLQLMDTNFAENLLDLLEKYKFPPNKLYLEIKDADGSAMSGFARSILQKVRSGGVRIILDDFHPGHTTTNNLSSLPVDCLKSERAFMQNSQDSLLPYFLSALAAVAQTNGLAYIAKGVELLRHLETIKDSGANYAQGYFLSKPLDRYALEKRLECFVLPQEKLFPLAPEPVNISQWLSRQNNMIMTPSLFRLLNTCLKTLLSGQEIDDAINNMLNIVGDYFTVQHAFVFTRNADDSYKNTNSWSAENGAERAQDLQNIFLSPALLRLFKEDGMVIASDTDSLDTDVREFTDLLTAKAVAMLPMWQGDDLVGFVGLDDAERRDWMPETIIVLWNLCLLMADKVRRPNAAPMMESKTNIITEVLNNTGLNVVVSDLETDEILWVNDMAKAQYGLDSFPEGRRCYELLQGRSERCPFCRVPELLANPDLGQITFEQHNDYWNRTFIVYSGLMDWEDGRKVHVEYSLDITEHKKNQTQLEHFATTDALTGVLNRNALIHKLKCVLHDAHQSQQTVSLAFVDVDKLKQANDLYGHSIGDELLLKTVEAIRGYVRTDDVVGRLGGDEFVIVFPQCRKNMAFSRMNRARNRLARNRLPSGESMTFSFGVAENNELAYSDNDAYLSQLIDIADSRMREFKLATVPEKDIR